MVDWNMMTSIIGMVVIIVSFGMAWGVLFTKVKALEARLKIAESVDAKLDDLKMLVISIVEKVNLMFEEYKKNR